MVHLVHRDVGLDADLMLAKDGELLHDEFWLPPESIQLFVDIQCIDTNFLLWLQQFLGRLVRSFLQVMLVMRLRNPECRSHTVNHHI